MNPGLSRREFLKTTAAVSAGLSVGPRIFAQSKPIPGGSVKGNADKSFKGFIVSDAHFGWKHEEQPAPEHQAEMMNRILERFPELDVFIDTGDAHHNYATPEDKGRWTEVIAGGCRSLPFFYVAGNHELDAWGYKYDPEWAAMELGSVSCRPYYSFDLQGIHLVSLPQMINMSYVSTEALDWLELDLSLNQDKSVIILSHNSLKGTTRYFSDIGYRQTSNSEMVLEIIRKHPNILAWMHGHNHTYEVVPVGQTIYVSNGRFGGFNPKDPGYYGKDNLGGIYFEAAPDVFKVMCYSATQDKFFHEMEHYDYLTHAVRRKTSFDLAEPAAVNYGYGGARDGQMIPVYSHHVGGRRKLTVTAAPSPVINENPDLAVYTQRTAENWMTKHLAGFSLEPLEENEVKSDESWQWMDPGVKILSRGENSGHKDLVMPGSSVGRRGYFRCPADRKYRAKITLVTEAPQPKMQFICWVNDRELERHHTLTSEPMELRVGPQTHEYVFDVPAVTRPDLIYNDSASDNCIQIAVGARFSDVRSDIFIRRFELTFADAKEGTIDPSVIVDGIPYEYEGRLGRNQSVSYNLPDRAGSRSAFKVGASGSRRLTWHLSQTAPRWQVRNAAAADKGDYFTVGPMRNTYSGREEIVITPLRPETRFVHRLGHITDADVYPADSEGTIRLSVRSLTGTGQADILCPARPSAVTGATWTWVDGVLTLTIEQPGSIEIKV